ELIGERKPDHVTLTIRDHGPGLEPGTERTIFEKFARGHGTDRDGGSGLGLAIAKGFAMAMQVDIAAANHPNGGAAFTLAFPIS
ncbi:ATP-binding protein, partial [Acinetobacter baumannii]